MAGVISEENFAYAGRWVAIVRGRVIAQGTTREQVFYAARSSRSKEDAEIRFMPVMPVNSPLLDKIHAVISPEYPLYLVGGAVRDAVLGKDVHDLDFACPQGLKTAKWLADRLSAAFFPLDEDFDTARVVIQNEDGSRDVLDFAGYRGATLEDDLRGRDFSINAVAMDMHTGEVVDPLGGVKAIREKQIRACSETAMSADPIRVLRGIRQAARFGFSIEPETRKQMKGAAGALNKISPERTRDELFKILEGPRPDAAIRALEMLGALQVVCPELIALKGVAQSAPHVHDVWMHTLSVLKYMEDVLGALAPSYDEKKGNADLMNGLLVLRLGRFRQQLGEHLSMGINKERSMRALLFFSALYHDVNKPQCKTIEESGRIRFFGHDEMGALSAEKKAVGLHLSTDEVVRIKLIVKNHMRVHAMINRRLEGEEISRKAVYRFFRDMGEGGVDVILLTLADTRATADHTLPQDYWAVTLDVCRELLEAWYEKPEEMVRPEVLINGDDLIKEFFMRPGPEIGRLLEAIRENQAAGKIGTREQALLYAAGWHDATIRAGDVRKERQAGK